MKDKKLVSARDCIDSKSSSPSSKKKDGKKETSSEKSTVWAFIIVLAMIGGLLFLVEKSFDFFTKKETKEQVLVSNFSHEKKFTIQTKANVEEWVNFGEKLGGKSINFFTPSQGIELIARSEKTGLICKPFKERVAICSSQDTGVWIKTDKPITLIVTLKN